MSQLPELPAIRRRGEQCRLAGDPAAAELLLRDALAIVEGELSADPRAVGNALNALGLACKDLARYEESHAYYQRALALLEPAARSASDWHDVATLYHNLGGIAHESGDYLQGEAHARRGIEIRSAIGDPDESALAADFVALAAILDGQRRYAEAEPLYRDALEIFECDPERHRWDIAVAHNDLGASFVQRGDLEVATDHLSRALALKRAALAPGHPDIAVTLNNLAVVQGRSGAWASAAVSYRDALELFERALGARHPRSLTCRENLARCLERQRCVV